MGAACDFSAGVLSCEYGGDALRRNTMFASCGATSIGAQPTWYVGSNDAAPNPAACPASWTDAMQGASCASDPNLACDYDEGRCGCVCMNTVVSWACRPRSQVYSSTSDVCPQPRPLAGDACTAENQQCLYDAVCGQAPLSFGPAMLCTDGYWELSVDTGAACGTLNCPGWTG